MNNEISITPQTIREYNSNSAWRVLAYKWLIGNLFN